MFRALEHHLLRLVHLLFLLEKRVRVMLLFLKCEKGRELLYSSKVITLRKIDVRILLRHIPMLYVQIGVLLFRHDETSYATFWLVSLQIIGLHFLPALATPAFLLRGFTLICL